ncbi:MAG: DUF2939 domain-containing protein [Gammaproteobacteria bacterium]
MMTLPYRILFGCLLLCAVAFGLSPWLTMQSIERASLGNDTERWPELIRQAGLQEYAGKMLAAMLDLKMYAEMEKNPREAMRDNLADMEQVPQTTQKLVGPKGISHLLCGELNDDPDAEMHIDTGCWALNGKLTWESLTRARVTFKNPETDWHSSLILERNGLFNWRGVAIELPVEAILDRFADRVGLKSSKPDSV